MHPKNYVQDNLLFQKAIHSFCIDDITQTPSEGPPKIDGQNKYEFETEFGFVCKSEVLFEPEYILPDGLTTVVKWTDGTKTVVRLSEGCEDQYDIYMAYLAALGKKLYGSTAKLHRVVETHTVDYLNEQKRLEVEKRRKEAEELAKKRHRQKVKAEVKKQMLAAEAYQEIMEHIARLSKFEE